MKPEADLENAHSFSMGNQAQLQQEQLCGCFYCRKIFLSSEIVEWVDDPVGTAVCPYCGIDAVVGESSQLPITPAFLKKMYQFWFTESE